MAGKLIERGKLPGYDGHTESAGLAGMPAGDRIHFEPVRPAGVVPEPPGLEPIADFPQTPHEEVALPPVG